MRWILASASPRRKQLLGELIEQFEIIPSNADESAQGRTPRRTVELLAERKAVEVASRKENEGAIVLGADTVVAIDGEILGKPKDEADAARMLSTLSGRWHEVYTGVCLAVCERGETRVVTRSDETKVRFKKLTREWIDEYVRSGSPMDKAGAYGIQDGGLVEEIAGSYTNVVGLPQELVKKMIEEERP